jgi:hypothetical protein
MPLTVTTQEVLDAIHRAHQATANPDGFTCRELAAALHLGLEPTRKRLRVLWESGQIETVRLTRPYMDGRISEVPGYRLVKGKGKKGIR